MASKVSSKDARKKKVTTVAVSGGFDPIHAGHVRMIREAAALGDRLVVIMNNDTWLKHKKGYAFMPQKERKEIIEAIAGVDEVVITSHKPGFTDRSVCAELKKIKPDIFANGGDRTGDNIPEVAVCNDIGCTMVFEVGRGGKMQSSSWLLKQFAELGNGLCGCGSGKKHKACHGKKK
jgi:D-beta-D-heptose 7-phosphate kinase/D-beta-D-heptose 1-phosphate adenosyltransferase